MNSSHRLVARMPDSRSGDASSSLAESIRTVQAICPHCEVSTTTDPIVGNFTVCLACVKVIRFDDELRLRKLNDSDIDFLIAERDLFIAILRWRLRILADQLKEQELGHIADGISSGW